MNHKQKIKTIVTKWAKANDVQLTDTSFYTAKEWAVRNEEFGNAAIANMCTEDELYEALNYGTVCDIPLSRKGDTLQEALEKEGYWYEQGCAWMFNFYEL